MNIGLALMLHMFLAIGAQQVCEACDLDTVIHGKPQKRALIQRSIGGMFSLFVFTQDLGWQHPNRDALPANNLPSLINAGLFIV